MFFHTSHIACMTKIRRNGSTDTWWKCKLSSKETAALFNILYNVLSNPEIPLLDRTLEKPRHILAQEPRLFIPARFTSTVEWIHNFRDINKIH